MLSIAIPQAHAQDAAPPLSLSLRKSADLWGNVHGGIATGAVILNKLQIAATASATPPSFALTLNGNTHRPIWCSPAYIGP